MPEPDDGDDQRDAGHGEPAGGRGDGERADPDRAAGGQPGERHAVPDHRLPVEGGAEAGGAAAVEHLQDHPGAGLPALRHVLLPPAHLPPRGRKYAHPHTIIPVQATEVPLINSIKHIRCIDALLHSSPTFSHYLSHLLQYEGEENRTLHPH